MQLLFMSPLPAHHAYLHPSTSRRPSSSSSPHLGQHARHDEVPVPHHSAQRKACAHETAQRVNGQSPSRSAEPWRTQERSGERPSISPRMGPMSGLSSMDATIMTVLFVARPAPPPPQSTSIQPHAQGLRDG